MAAAIPVATPAPREIDVNRLMNISHVLRTLHQKPAHAEKAAPASHQRVIEKVDYVASLICAEKERARQAQGSLNVFRVENLVRNLGGIV